MCPTVPAAARDEPPGRRILPTDASVNRILRRRREVHHVVVNASMWSPRSAVLSTAVLLLAIGLSGCGLTIPADPDGTLSSVTGSELRVGVTSEPGLVDVERATPTGSLPDLVGGFADSIDAEIDWTDGSEETLVGMLERGDLDLVIGGFTASTPWIDKAGVTRAYPGIDGAEGRQIVMLVPLGENAFLSELERYLDEEVGS